MAQSSFIRKKVKYLNAIKTMGKVALMPKMSFLANNIIICRMIIVNDEDTFPVVCFNSFAISVTELCKEDSSIKIQGSLKDYSYLDDNNTVHYIKVLLANKVIIGAKTIIENNLEEIDRLWYSVKNIYKVLDILDFEKMVEKEEANSCYL